MVEINIEIIGRIHSCFTEKFGIPRQPGLVKSATAVLQFYPPFDREEMVRGLEKFSHLWIHFLFHETVKEGWRPTARPPGLGGQKRVGVFSCRTPHRPNHLGLSVVKLEEIRFVKNKPELHLSGVDILNDTPVVDIKPYVTYSDSVPEARCGFVSSETVAFEVHFSPRSDQFCHTYEKQTGRKLQKLITEVISQDPRPASQREGKTGFGMLLWDVNIRWSFEDGRALVLECYRVSS